MDLGCGIEKNRAVDSCVVVEIKLVRLNEIARRISEEKGQINRTQNVWFNHIIIVARLLEQGHFTL